MHGARLCPSTSADTAKGVRGGNKKKKEEDGCCMEKKPWLVIVRDIAEGGEIAAGAGSSSASLFFVGVRGRGCA